MRTHELFKTIGWFRKEYCLAFEVSEAADVAGFVLDKMHDEIQKWRKNRGKRATHLAICIRCERLPSDEQEKKLKEQYREGLRGVADGLKWLIEFRDKEGKWVAKAQPSPQQMADFITGKWEWRPC